MTNPIDAMKHMNETSTFIDLTAKYKKKKYFFMLFLSNLFINKKYAF